MTSEKLFTETVENCWILDSSAIIQIKHLIPPSAQWDIFKKLEELVISGIIAMPQQVISEVKTDSHPDVPGAWVSGIKKHLKYPLDPDSKFVRLVMSEVGDVVDKDKGKEEADPYVIALALQLMSDNWSITVVTEDVKDRIHRHDNRQGKRSLKSACEIMEIEVCQTIDFFDRIGLFELLE